MIKKILSFSTSGILVLAGITVIFCCLHNNKQGEEFKKLEKTNSDLHKKLAEDLTNTADLELEVERLLNENQILKLAEDLTNTSDLELEIERLFDENQIFTSMLAEIENEPGGHEILQRLWQYKTGYTESDEAQE